MKITRYDLREFILREIATISDEAKKRKKKDEKKGVTPPIVFTSDPVEVIGKRKRLP